MTAQALEMGEENTQVVFWSALLHDIGKAGVPEYVLIKAGPLTEKEWEMMRLHPTIGANIVKSMKPLAHLAPAIYSHQEKFDGTGYPDGLKGKEIPIGARILAIADAYEAMTSDRAYRRARSREDAMDELQRMGGQQFDPEIVDIFLSIAPEEEPEPLFLMAQNLSETV